MLTPSARRAAIILMGGTAPPATEPFSAGESERLELIEALASEIKQGDHVSRRVCRRLLVHLSAAVDHAVLSSRLQ